MPPQPAAAAAPVAPAINDPHALGVAVSRFSGSARRASKAAVAVVGALLGDGELVECAVHGQFYGASALGVMTNRRLLLVNDREWKPDVASFNVDGALTIQGWQDERTASLMFQSGAQTAQLERIGDRPLAMEMAQRLRARAGGQG
jgi:hypothetical protein